jgi:hypothetical protein
MAVGALEAALLAVALTNKVVVESRTIGRPAHGRLLNAAEYKVLCSRYAASSLPSLKWTLADDRCSVTSVARAAAGSAIEDAVG